VAAGHTNREVAQALFVSVHTVEDNLRRIYRKLGVRSRTELAAGRPRPGWPAPPALTGASSSLGCPGDLPSDFRDSPRARTP